MVRSLAALALLAGVAPAARVGAQQVTFAGHADPEVDRRIAGVLAGGRYTLLSHDTTIGAGDTLHGPVLATGIRLRLNGTVSGDLVSVASDLFVHPRASVSGALVNAGGGLYASSQARVGETVDRPLAHYAVTRSGGTIVIQASPTSSPPLALDALKGLHLPTYDRVDGLWLQAGARLRLPAPPALDSARLHLVGGWRTAGPGFSGMADLQLLRGRYSLLLGGQQLTATSDRWIRGDLANSLSFITIGNDYRDYYDARRLFGVLARDLDRGRWAGHLALRAQREDAAALGTHDVFVLFKPDTLRPNPPADGRIASLTGQGTARWGGAGDELQVTGTVEAAGHVLGGDFAFGRYAVNASATIQTFWGHSLDVDAHLQGPLPGTDTLPAQRWSHVGGPATLPTFAIGAFRGDRVVYVSEEYLIPLPSRLHVPMLGTSPALALVHASGMAWRAGQGHTLEQNLGAELRLFGLALSAYADPARGLKSTRFGAGFSLSAGRLPSSRPYFDTAEAER
ncbi:MAG TPA: hypothetical protein VF832_09275 [Longimicrobiales bacterium]